MMSFLHTTFIGKSTHDIKLGNFYPAEFACPHCHVVMIHEDLWRAVQMIRDAAMAPVIINSGFRCSIHNQVVGGSENSDHLYGFAADICIPGMTADEVGKIAARFPQTIKRIGVYMNKDFVHIGVRDRGVRTWRRWRYDEAGGLTMALEVE